MNKNCLLVLIGEPTPFDEDTVRLRRAGILSKHLIKKGFNVYVWTNNFSHNKKRHRKFFIKTIKENNKKITYFTFPTLGYKKNISILRLLDHIAFSIASSPFLTILILFLNPKFIYTSYPPEPLVFVTALISKLLRKPCIVDVRDLWPEILFLGKQLNSLIFLKKLLFYSTTKFSELTLSLCSKVITISNGFENFLIEEKNINKKRIQIHPLCLNQLPSKRNLSRPIFNNINKKINIVCAANYGSPLKFNFKPLVEFINFVSGNYGYFIELNLAGDGEGLEEILNNQLYSIKNNIILHGWLSEKKLYKLYKKMHLGFIPYKPRLDFSRSLPNKYIEYLSHSLPILTALDGCVESHLLEHNIGFSLRDKENFKLIFSSISDHNKLSKLSQNAFQISKNYFNPNIVYDQIINYLY